MLVRVDRLLSAARPPGRILLTFGPYVLDMFYMPWARYGKFAKWALLLDIVDRKIDGLAQKAKELAGIHAASNGT